MSRVTYGNNGITRGYNAITHRGVDIGWHTKEEDNQILAHSNGTVVWTQTGQKNNKKAKGNASYGNAIKIKHSNGYYTLYAHLESVKVKKGQTVKQGQVIGIMGNTGNSYGRHLHFEVRNKKDIRINPTKYIYCDLPNMNKYYYEVYDIKKEKWLPQVKVGSSDYAGNKGNNIGALEMDYYTYRVHDKNKKKWLPWVEGRNDYAGNGTPIDGVQIKGAKYRVYDNVKKKWLPWVNGDSDFAGNIGNAIGGVQIK